MQDWREPLVSMTRPGERRSVGGHARRLFLAALLAFPPVLAAAQSSIVANFPCPGPSPGGCRIGRASVGDEVTLGVSVGEGFVGTVSFSSSDPLAALPGTVTFDGSLAGGEFPVVFRTTGQQLVTVTDRAGGLTPGTANILVVPASTAIPDVSDAARLVFGALLGVGGVWFLRGRPV